MAFKFAGIGDTATYIAAAGLPFALFLAWIAAFFELALVLCFLTGAFFTEAALAAAAYVLFLGFTFHGPAHWSGNQAELGFFVLLAAMGTCMGMAFPLGMRVAQEREPELGPWLWGVNGAMSVLASVLAVVIAMAFGISVGFACGVACYLGALVAFRQAARGPQGAVF